MELLEYKSKKFSLKSGIVFGIAATLPYLIFAGFDFSRMRDKQQIAFILLPMICGLLIGGLFGRFIKYDPLSIWGGIFKALGWSLIIFFSSIFIWCLLAFALAGSKSFFFGFLAITHLGVLTYPPALLAGVVVWLSEKYKKSR